MPDPPKNRWYAEIFLEHREQVSTVDPCSEGSVPQLTHFYFVEKSSRKGKTSPAIAPGINGKGSVKVVWPEIREPAETRFYLSGPPAMLKYFFKDQRHRGIPPEAIKIDSWE